MMHNEKSIEHHTLLRSVAAMRCCNIVAECVVMSRVTDKRHCVAGDGHQLGHDVHEDGEGEHHSHACNSASL